MARISTYPTDNNITAQDKVLGTDQEGLATRNYTIGGIANWLNTSGAFVPYIGALQDLNLGTHRLLASDLTITHTSGGGPAAFISKTGGGEALTVTKLSGGGNAASITGGVTLISDLHLTTDLADAYIASAPVWNAKQNAISLTTLGNSGPATFIGSTLNVPQYAGVSSLGPGQIPVGSLTGDLLPSGASVNGSLFEYTQSGTSLPSSIPNFISSDNGLTVNAFALNGSVLDINNFHPFSNVAKLTALGSATLASYDPSMGLYGYAKDFITYNSAFAQFKVEYFGGDAFVVDWNSQTGSLFNFQIASFDPGYYLYGGDIQLALESGQLIASGLSVMDMGDGGELSYYGGTAVMPFYSPTFKSSAYQFEIYNTGGNPFQLQLSNYSSPTAGIVGPGGPMIYNDAAQGLWSLMSGAIEFSVFGPPPSMKFYVGSGTMAFNGNELTINNKPVGETFLDIIADGSIGGPTVISFYPEAIVPAGTIGTQSLKVDFLPDISSYGLEGFTASYVAFPTLENAQSIAFVQCPSLFTLELPNLIFAKSIRIESNINFTTLNLNSLVTCQNNLSFSDIPNAQLNFPSLTTARVSLNNNSSIVSVDSSVFPVIETLGLSIQDGSTLNVFLPTVKTLTELNIYANNLTTANIPNVVNFTNSYMGINYRPMLTSLILGGVGITKKWGSGNPYINFSNNALDQSSVDNILTMLASLDGTNGTTISNNGTLLLNGGSNQGPSGAGLSVITVLLNRGWNISTN